MKRRKITIILIMVLAIVLAVLLTLGSFTVEMDTAPKGNATIAVTGDVMFARNMAGVLSGGTNPFAGVDNVTSKTDLLLINFENAATDSASAVKGDVPLKTSTDLVSLAKDNENTVAALANNHAFDYGIDGMHDTVAALKENGITVIGAGDNADEAHQSVTQEINGRKITIFNYMDSQNFAEYSNEVMPVATENSSGYSAYDSDVATKQIREAKENGSDFVLVYFHYGNEYSRSPNEYQINMSHEVIDAGADVVLGSHPHVTQGIEMYNGSPIFYSLGNFIFDQQRSDTHRAYFVELDLQDENVTCTVYPINIVGYLPQFMSPAEGKALLEELNPQCGELEITSAGTGIIRYNLTA